MFTKVFNEDLELLKTKIINKEPFAFPRYADYEVDVILNRKVTNCDGITITENEEAFGKEMFETLLHQENNYFYGISCPCCDVQSFNFYQRILSNSWDRVSYSNLFVNSNWNSAVDFLMNYKNKVFIVNENSKLKQPFYKVPSNVFVSYRNDRESLKTYYENLAEKHNETLFCISAGPLAEIIIHWMYLKNNNNQYIDTGSSLDMFIHNNPTRA